MKQRDLDFFQPLWRRVAITVLCALWSAFEWYSGEPLWGMVTAALVFYCYWNFFHTFEEQASDSANKDDKPQD